MLKPYLHQHPEWPHLRWDHTALEPLLRRTRTRRDHLNARVESLGIPLTEQMHLDTLSSDVVKTSEIEGETLNLKAVRSSVAWRLGILPEGVPSGDDAVEGIVQITADATFNHAAPLSEERLFEWHAALFPAGRSAGRPITVGGWRVHPIQVVSGAIGQERVHFEGPDHQTVPEEMTRFLQWLNSPPESGLTVHAALAHLRFVTIHPFDDGNGRIARAVSDMLLTRDDGNPRRLYSMSAQIHTDRAQYYRMLEETQRVGTADVTPWIAWFLECLARAVEASSSSIDRVIARDRIRRLSTTISINPRQQRVLDLLVEGQEGRLPQGRLSVRRWTRICRCSPEEAEADIAKLVAQGLLVTDPDPGGDPAWIMHPDLLRPGKYP